jgi:hypothetical protein
VERKQFHHGGEIIRRGTAIDKKHALPTGPAREAGDGHPVMKVQTEFDCIVDDRVKADARQLLGRVDRCWRESNGAM